MQIDMTSEERDILIRWKKRSDTYKLVRMKAEAIVYAARGVGLDMARIKQNGILGQLLRDSWLAFTEGLL